MNKKQESQLEFIRQLKELGVMQYQSTEFNVVIGIDKQMTTAAQMNKTSFSFNDIDDIASGKKKLSPEQQKLMFHSSR